MILQYWELQEDGQKAVKHTIDNIDEVTVHEDAKQLTAGDVRRNKLDFYHSTLTNNMPDDLTVRVIGVKINNEIHRILLAGESGYVLNNEGKTLMVI